MPSTSQLTRHADGLLNPEPLTPLKLLISKPYTSPLLLHPLPQVKLFKSSTLLCDLCDGCFPGLAHLVWGYPLFVMLLDTFINVMIECLQGTFHERCMLPLIDMCNHDSTDTTCRLCVRLSPSGAPRYLPPEETTSYMHRTWRTSLQIELQKVSCKHASIFKLQAP